MDSKPWRIQHLIDCISGKSSVADFSKYKHSFLRDQLLSLENELQRKCLATKTIENIVEVQDELNSKLLERIRALEHSLEEKVKLLGILENAEKKATEAVADKEILVQQIRLLITEQEQKINKLRLEDSAKSNADVFTKFDQETQKWNNQLKIVSGPNGENTGSYEGENKENEDVLIPGVNTWDLTEQPKCVPFINADLGILKSQFELQIELTGKNALNLKTQAELEKEELKKEVNKERQLKEKLQEDKQDEIDNLLCTMVSERFESKKEIAKMKRDLRKVVFEFEINGEQHNQPLYPDFDVEDQDSEGDCSEKDTELGCTKIVKSLIIGLKSFACEVSQLNARYTSGQTKSKNNGDTQALLKNFSAVCDNSAEALPEDYVSVPDAELDAKNFEVQQMNPASPDNRKRKRMKSWDGNGNVVNVVIPRLLINFVLNDGALERSPNFDAEDDPDIHWALLKRNPIYRRYNPRLDEIKTHKPVPDFTNLYRCVCGYRFQTDGSLRIYIKVMSDDNWEFQCEKCSEQFYYESEFKLHKNRITDCKKTKDARDRKAKANKLKRENQQVCSPNKILED